MKLRPFDYTDRDYHGLITIWNAIWTDTPASGEFERRNDQQRDPKYLFERLVVEGPASLKPPGQILAMPKAALRVAHTAVITQIHAKASAPASSSK